MKTLFCALSVALASCAAMPAELLVSDSGRSIRKALKLRAGLQQANAALQAGVPRDMLKREYSPEKMQAMLDEMLVALPDLVEGEESLVLVEGQVAVGQRAGQAFEEACESLPKCFAAGKKLVPGPMHTRTRINKAGTLCSGAGAGAVWVIRCGD